MTTYKNIKGKRIKRFATDLDNEQAEGQIFYSDTDNEFKTAVASSAWASASPLISGRNQTAAAGTQTASILFGGKFGPPPNADTGTTQEYNGSGWSNGGTMTDARYELAGAGTQTAGLGFGGIDGGSNTAATEEYNGSSWSNGGNMTLSVYEQGGAGTQTAALAFGGQRQPEIMEDNTQKYDGSSWTNTGDLNQARRFVFSFGTQTAAVAAGGTSPPAPNTTHTEEFDGSSWTTVNSMNSGRRVGGSSGILTAGLAYGGADSSPSNKTEQYDGTTWSAESTLGSARYNHCGAGTNDTTALFAAGGPPSGLSITEEYTVTVNTITAAAWSSGGNLNTARSRGSGGGTLTAGICVNGITVDVEEYDGTSWSEQNNMPTALRDISGFGTQTAFVGCAGYQPGGSPVNTGSTYEYDGSNWTSGGTMNVGRDGTSLHFGGVLTAGLVNGGGTPPYKQTEEYNGTSWSNANASSLDHYRTNITGTQTAAFIFGGYGIDPGGPQTNLSVTFTEEYDGTNFSSGDTLLQGANAPLGMSNSNKDDSTCAAGFDQASGSRLSLTQNYNGTVWATGASLGTARYAGTGGGSAAGGFVAAGHVPPTTTATEELTAETTSLNLKTITDS